VGTRFDIALPLAEPSAAPGPGFAQGDALPPPAPAGDKRVLYIEDNEVNLLIVRELVAKRRDLEFVGAVDGTSGLAAAQAQRPALILLDMQLPDMDGHAVLQRLRADPATAGIRVIALSANAMPEDIRRALDNGFDGYWTKPLDLKAFLRAMDELFGPAPPRT
jgi:CheY-like chemotaxis protein